VTSLDGMAAEQWEVRNAASLAFATLVLRTVGIRNVVKVSAGDKHVPRCVTMRHRIDASHSQHHDAPRPLMLQDVQMHGPVCPASCLT